MFRELKLKAVYRSDEDNLLEDFYIPALSHAVAYDRAVGFFSASMLSYAVQGLSAFVRNDGRMRLVFGGELAEEDFDALQRGYEARRILELLGRSRRIEALGEEFCGLIDRVADPLFQRRLELLSWLVANGRIDVKVALKQRGMYHEKIGILRDAQGDQIIFQGSANESSHALLPDFNFESINVFPSWKSELEDHFLPYVSGFERLWGNRTTGTVVVDFPAAARDRLVAVAKRASLPTREIEVELWRRSLDRYREVEPVHRTPRAPMTLNGEPFQLRDHQRNALNAWRAQSWRGVMPLATGAGKTITAIYGVTRIFERTKRLFVVIAVPYQNLADQWIDALREFSIYAIPCYADRAQWLAPLSETVSLFRQGATPFACAVVVNATLASDDFQRLLREVPGEVLAWIGDECHHHGAQSASSLLPETAKIRLGLSATPEHYLDGAANARLVDYYGPLLPAYSLADAVSDGVLTPYDYFIELVDLTVEEAEAYAELSKEIALKFAVSGGDPEAPGVDEGLQLLLFRRARLLSSAENKIVRLQAVLRDQRPTPLTLFYCGEGERIDLESGDALRHTDAVARLLDTLHWRVARFTSLETREERRRILDSFRLGELDGLVAIRCLDEGIDIPACRRAFILASSRNPRQFIQRRGRILRRSPGKEKAVIHDFLVSIPEELCEGAPHERRLFLGELRRVKEFAMMSLNPGESVRVLAPLLERYDAEHHLFS